MYVRNAYRKMKSKLLFIFFFSFLEVFSALELELLQITGSSVSQDFLDIALMLFSVALNHSVSVL